MRTDWVTQATANTDAIFDDRNPLNTIYEPGFEEVERRVDLELGRPILEDALSTLTPQQRRAVQLRMYGLTQKQIAKAMNVSFQRVGQLLKQARRRLSFYVRMFRFLAFSAREHGPVDFRRCSRVAAEVTQSRFRKKEASQPE